MTLLFVFILLIGMELSYCHTIQDTNKLLKDKLTGYNKNTRQTFNQSNPTVVNFQLELVYIQEFDEVQQKLSFIAVPILRWVDEEISWNPADYGGIYSVVAQSSQFWLPNVVLANTAGEAKPLGDDWQLIGYFEDGSSFYSPQIKISSICSADITYYPYDKHTCELFFTTQGYRASEVYLIANEEKIGRTYYFENGGWDFVDSSITAVNSEYYVQLIVTITLQRKLRYVIINVILPFVFLAYLSNVVFVIPVDCGERISYSITVLLAIAVYLTIVGDNLPKTSFPMSYFSFYLLTMLMTGILITIVTIFNLRIFHSDESVPVTGEWAKITSCFKCRMQNKRKKYTQDRNDAHRRHQHQKRIIGGMNKRNLFVPTPQEARRSERHLDTIEKPEMMSSHDKIDKVGRYSWKEVSVALDKIFFLIFIIVLTVATVVYVVVIASEQTN